MPAPQAIAEDDYMLSAWLTFFRKKIATHQQGQSLHREEARGLWRALDLLRSVVGGHVKGASGPGPHVRERSASSLPIKKVAGRNRVPAALYFGPQHDQLVRLGIRHRLEDRIDHAEDR